MRNKWNDGKYTALGLHCLSPGFRSATLLSKYLLRAYHLSGPLLERENTDVRKHLVRKHKNEEDNLK